MYKDIQKEFDYYTTIVLPWNLSTMKSLKVVWTVVDTVKPIIIALLLISRILC